ncbi:MAG: competence/damage-inducible protein A [Actinobacteria bacterium]|jgi:nicotinamide-nucleotide amidase|nr:competence/damage-inducible protein A [Actinomycetota bacterium]
MRCDVVAIGTELLLGQIVDTNSSWLGEQLSAAGIDSCLQVKVGDNLNRMVKAIRQTLEDADAVIICGGLGPTHDDITREAIAEIMGVELEFNDEVGMAISEMFASRNRRMPEINMRQAMVPKGANIIEQRRGTAPGLICPVGNKVIYAVPGVPYELYEMFERAILPDLLVRSGSVSVISSRVLRTWGESESGLNERLFGVIEELESVGNPTLAFLASGWEGIKVRLTAKAATRPEVVSILDEWEQKVRAAIGDIVFGIDDDTMESVVLQMLRDRGLTLGLAESVTGGLVSGRLTNIAGASDVLRGAVVSYASEVKFDVLGVTNGPVVSPEAAVEMAVGAQRVLGADVALSLTGVAGPAEQEGQRPGTLCIGVALPNGVTASSVVQLPGARDQMRQLSVISALDFLRRQLRES